MLLHLRFLLGLLHLFGGRGRGFSRPVLQTVSGHEIGVAESVKEADLHHTSQQSLPVT